MSQLPSLESAAWASIIGAVMSIGYSTIALGLGASQASSGLGSLGGRPAEPYVKITSAFSALGSIGFAYGCVRARGGARGGVFFFGARACVCFAFLMYVCHARALCPLSLLAHTGTPAPH